MERSHKNDTRTLNCVKSGLEEEDANRGDGNNEVGTERMMMNFTLFCYYAISVADNK